MEFSEPCKFSGVCAFSPSGQYVATAADYRLVIREVESLQIIQIYTCSDKINHIEWSFDSQYILCAMHKRAVVQVWAVDQPDWTCKIDEGPAGLTRSRWSPDGRHILNTSEFQVRITIWSLINQSLFYIQFPKFANHGIDFTSDGNYLAIAERRDCKDFISIYLCDAWQMLTRFPVDTFDLADLKWSPDSSAIVTWDNSVEYKVLVYSPDGRQLHHLSPYQHALGVKTVNWSPSSQFLAIGSYDEKVRVLNNLTWKCMTALPHLAQVNEPGVVVYQEVESRDASEGLPGVIRARYVIGDLPINIPRQKVIPDKPNPKIGISLVSWSPDGTLLATINDSQPNAVWIWNISKLDLAVVLLQKNDVTTAKWSHHDNRLAVSTGNGRVYFWSPAGAGCADVPRPGFQVQSLDWNTDSSAMILKGKNSFVICYPLEGV